MIYEKATKMFEISYWPIGLGKFLDVHSFQSLGESTVKELQQSPPEGLV